MHTRLPAQNFRRTVGRERTRPAARDFAHDAGSSLKILKSIEIPIEEEVATKIEPQENIIMDPYTMRKEHMAFQKLLSCMLHECAQRNASKNVLYHATNGVSTSPPKKHLKHSKRHKNI